MASIATNSPEGRLASIVVVPGDGDNDRTISTYPSKSTVSFNYSGTKVKLVTPNYPGWDASRLGTETLLFKLKDDVSVIYTQSRANPDIGAFVSGRLKLRDKYGRDTEIGRMDLASVFVVMGMIFEPGLRLGEVAALAYASDYGSPPVDFGERLLRIDKYVDACTGVNFSGDNPTSIAQNYEGGTRFVFKYADYFFDGNYYTSEDVDTAPLDTDPFAPGGNTDPSGGTGDFDGTSEPVDVPALPSVSAADTGFITLFNPTLSQLKELSTYMWSGAFDVATFRKLFADPMDCILGLSIVPVAVPNAGLAPVKVGNISTGIEMNIATSQYVTVDCGAINVNEYWGAYLDYDPYTKAEIYLPYIGTHPIATDDIMGKAVHVVYHVDILSGACTAYVKCGDSVLYSYIGQVSSSIPVTGNDWTNVINGVLSIAGSVGSMIATAGATTPLAVSSIASTAINSNKPSIARSGSMSGTGGMLALQTPYLILTRPRQAVPANQNKYTGYPAFITSNLGSLEGYTEIESIHLEGVPATESELNEIKSILKAGVIF